MYCGFCYNRFVDHELDESNDASSIMVGQTAESYSIFIDTGWNFKTRLHLMKWNKEHQQNETIGIYVPKFCPECGRKLFENEPEYNLR